MESSSRYVADLADWRLTQGVECGQSAPPLLQASLTFAAGTGPRVGSTACTESDGFAADRRLATGSLQLSLGSPARATLTGSLQDADAGHCTVEATLAREQFDWLLSLVDQPNCDVQLDFELSEQLLKADADGKTTAELVSPRYWATTTCGAGTLFPGPLTPQGVAARNHLLRSNASFPRTPLAQIAAESARLLLLHRSRHSDADSGHEWQEDSLRDFVAAVRAAMAEESATAALQGEVTATTVAASLACPRPPKQQVHAAEPGAAMQQFAAAPPVAATHLPVTAATATGGQVDGEPMPSGTPTDRSRAAMPPMSEDDCGIIGTMASLALPGAGPDLEAPAVESLQQQLTAPDSLHIPIETQLSLEAATLAEQPGLREEVSARAREPVSASTPHGAETAPGQEVTPPTSPGHGAEAATTPTLSPLPATALPLVNLPPARSGAKRLRPMLGLTFTALLVIALWGYWSSDRGNEPTDKLETTSALPALNAVAQQAAAKPSPTSVVVTQAAPAMIAAPRKTDETPVPTSESTIMESAGSQGQSSAADPDASALPAPSASGRPATEVVPDAPQKLSAAAPKAAPRPAPRAHDTGRSRTRKSEAKAAERSEPAKAEPTPSIPPVAVAAPPIEPAAAVPRPIQAIQPERPVPDAAPEPCSGLTGLKLGECRACGGFGTARRYVCERSFKFRYCAGKWGNTPDCPWQSAAGEDGSDRIKP